MRGKFILAALIALLFCVPNVFAQEGHDHHNQEGAMMGQMEKEMLPVGEVGNKICPVSGEKVGVMGPVVQYEYENKIYNFCCGGCIKTFKEDPDKYIKIIEQQKEAVSEIQAD